MAYNRYHLGRNPGGLSPSMPARVATVAFSGIEVLEVSVAGGHNLLMLCPISRDAWRIA